MALTNLWGSYFSRYGGKAMSMPFRRGFLNRVGLNVGPLLSPAEIAPDTLRQQVAVLAASR